jgi:deazaflavin-dependent oxidoreductase (nitroreductase family)
MPDNRQNNLVDSTVSPWFRRSTGRSTADATQVFATGRTGIQNRSETRLTGEQTMPIPRAIARANRVGFNQLARHIARWAPGFGVIVHRGRASGRMHQTPVNVFRTADGYLIALTYGRQSDWVKNVLAAGEAELRTRGRRLPVRAERLYHDEERHGIPAAVRPILRLLDVTDFLALRKG